MTGLHLRARFFARPLLALLLCAGAAVKAHANPFDYQDPNQPERAVRMWLPPGLPRVNGMIVWGNAGTGDSRASVLNPVLRAWASNNGFGLLCTKALSVESAPVVFEALRAFASVAAHAELREVPFVALGHSNGGLVALGLTKAAPARAIGFAMNKAAVFVPDMPPASYSVPAIFVAGEFDLERRKAPMKAMFEHYRAHGALWAFVEEQNTGHAGRESRAMDLIVPFLQRAITKRLLANTFTLRPLDAQEGWLAPVGPSRGTPVPVMPFASYKGNRRTAAWLLDEDTARLFSAVATFDRPLRFTIAKSSDDREENAAALAAPGDPVELVVETFAADEHWQRFVWFDGADVVGQTTAPDGKGDATPQGARPRLQARLRTGVHGLWVQGHRKDGRIFVAAPSRVIVSGGSGNPLDAQASVPTLLVQPVDQTITEGEVATFEVRATGGPDVRYQWLRNNEPLAGATHPTVRLPNQAAAHHGDVFSVRVSNQMGATQSLPARLYVAPFAGADATYVGEPPLIDGRVDKVWLTTQAYPVANVIAGSREGVLTTARWRALWDHQALYVLIEGNDEEMYSLAPDPWSNDTTEVFLEGSNNKSVRWGAYGYQFGLPFGREDIVEAFTGKVPEGVRGQRSLGLTNAHRYVAEYRFPEAALGVSFVAGLRLGFDVQVNDCNNAGVRRIKLAWHGQRNNAYEGPIHLGIVRLAKPTKRMARSRGTALVPIQR